VKLADRLGIQLRQNYNRQAPRLAGQVGRYAHAKQYKRMRATLKKLRTVVGRVWRDIDRQRETLAPEHAKRTESILSRVRRLLDQKPKDKNKLYSLHAPEVECIAKGKVRQPYEFGVKVTVATTHREGLVVGMRSLLGNPFDGHTLAEAIEQMEILTEQKPKAVFVDKGYQGAEVPGVKVWRSGMRRGVTRRLKQDIRRRSAVEPMIGHMKNEGVLRRNWLRGSLGDELHAVLCGAGHNLRMILRKLLLLRVRILALSGRFICLPGSLEKPTCASRIHGMTDYSGPTR
jgi:IS5 family transposase